MIWLLWEDMEEFMWVNMEYPHKKKKNMENNGILWFIDGLSIYELHRFATLCSYKSHKVVGVIRCYKQA